MLSISNIVTEKTMRALLIIFSFLVCLACNTGENSKPDKYVVHSITLGDEYLYSIINAKNDTILKLTPDKYWTCFSDTVEKFLIVAPKDRKGWWAIDFNENFLFQVYNTSEGEPSPDEINFNRIRIVNKAGKIGFANEKGDIVIEPRFEQATSFFKEYAIIGEECKKIAWDTIRNDSDIHYSIACSRNGYINMSGDIIEIGNFTFEEVWKKLGFPER
jgi:hypothetical protein